jgi:D-sedoheptulose 7-phosphate isomerase/D-glycero-D-manno-heptose 1,7-bisphosphate phosphatase
MTAVYDMSDLVAGSPAVPEKFPSSAYTLASSYCEGYFAELARASASIDLAAVQRAAAVLVEAYTNGANVFACGNGGSAAIANHFQCDHLKGVRHETDLLPKVISLSTSTELLTAIANDIGYEEVFSYQLQSQARPGDVLVAISSSGRSANIVNAISWARDNDVRTVAMTGFQGGDARKLAEVALHVASINYGIVEDLHQTLAHALAQFIRQSRMTAGTIAATTF